MKKLLFSKYSIPFFVGAGVYLVFKLLTLSIRLSDSNIYFVTASHLAHGSLLYRDIFFTNFPLHPYISVIYYFLLGGSLKWYFFTPALEASVVAILIYIVVLSRTKSYLVSTLSGFVYLFSVLLLITTDHQTGVFLASIFAVLSYFFNMRKQYVLVGVMCALMLLVKAYFLPVALTYVAYFLLHRQFRELLRFCLGGVGVGLVALLPFLLFARQEILSQIFGYSLTRSAGIPKAEVARFFLFRDFLIVAILVFNAFCIRKRLFWGLFSIFALLFFVFYQDTYYLYLNYTLPFAALSFSYLYKYLERVLHAQKFVLPTFLGLFFLWNMHVAYSGFATLGSINQIEEIVELVKSVSPEYVYGNNDIAPAVSYLSGVPQLGGIVDTNENMFRNGVLDANRITEDIFSNKTILVLHSAYYPQLGIENDSFSEILDGEQVKNKCVLLKRFPVHAEGVTNAVAVFRCY